MFTGIVEAQGMVTGIDKEGANIHFTLRASLAPELKVDQSLSHDGTCLTVTAIDGDSYRVTAIDETLRKTKLGGWQIGQQVNLERAMLLGSRLDGHIVQGHVDAVGHCLWTREEGGSHLFRFRYPAAFAALVIEKGSICIDGVSLTAFDLGADELSVAIIPYTYAHTGFGRLKAGDPVNLEFDILGKYLLRQQSLCPAP